MINYQCWKQFCLHLYIVIGGCMVACRQHDDDLVIEAETCCHLVTLNKINIHNTSCVLTCESLLLTCIHLTQRG